jgi:hypothetical protein
MNFINHNFDEINITLIQKSKIEKLIKEIKEIDNTKDKFSCKQFLLSNNSKLVSLEKINLSEFEIKNNDEEEKNIFDIFKNYISNEKIKFVNLETSKFIFRKNDIETFISINLSTIHSDITYFLNNLPNNLTNLEIQYIPYTCVNYIVKKITNDEEDLDEDDRNYFYTDVNFNYLDIDNFPNSLKKIKFKLDICRCYLFTNIILDKIKINHGVDLEFNFINSNYIKKVCVKKIALPVNIKNIIIKYLPETRISLFEDMLDVSYEIINDVETKNKLIMDKILSNN